MLKDEVRKRSEKRDQKEEEKFTEALLRELDKIYRDYIERIFFRRKKLPGIKGPREKPTIKITLEDGAEDKDKEKEGVKRPRRFISGTYNVIMLL